MQAVQRLFTFSLTSPTCSDEGLKAIIIIKILFDVVAQSQARSQWFLLLVSEPACDILEQDLRVQPGWRGPSIAAFWSQCGFIWFIRVWPSALEVNTSKCETVKCPLWVERQISQDVFLETWRRKVDLWVHRPQPSPSLISSNTGIVSDCCKRDVHVCSSCHIWSWEQVNEQ